MVKLLIKNGLRTDKLNNFLKKLYRKLIQLGHCNERKLIAEGTMPSIVIAPVSTKNAHLSDHYTETAPVTQEDTGSHILSSITEPDKEQLKKEWPIKVGKTPDPKQWDVVKTASNNVCVWAGAGSGKTLSLVWRVVFLHVYLGIDLNEITVLSFTKKSVEKFREDLIEALRQFKPKDGPDPYSKEIESSVRTFHSKILEFGRISRLSASSKRMFEHQKTKDQQDKDEEDLVDEIYNKSAIPPRQSEILTKRCLHMFDSLYRRPVWPRAHTWEIARQPVIINQSRYKCITSVVEQPLDIVRKLLKICNTAFKIRTIFYPFGYQNCG